MQHQQYQQELSRFATAWHLQVATAMRNHLSHKPATAATMLYALPLNSGRLTVVTVGLALHTAVQGSQDAARCQ